MAGTTTTGAEVQAEIEEAPLGGGAAGSGPGDEANSETSMSWAEVPSLAPADPQELFRQALRNMTPEQVRAQLQHHMPVALDAAFQQVQEVDAADCLEDSAVEDELCRKLVDIRRRKGKLDHLARRLHDEGSHRRLRNTGPGQAVQRQAQARAGCQHGMRLGVFAQVALAVGAAALLVVVFITHNKAVAKMKLEMTEEFNAKLELEAAEIKRTATEASDAKLAQLVAKMQQEMTEACRVSVMKEFDAKLEQEAAEIKRKATEASDAKLAQLVAKMQQEMTEVSSELRTLIGAEAAETVELHGFKEWPSFAGQYVRAAGRRANGAPVFKRTVADGSTRVLYRDRRGWWFVGREDNKLVQKAMAGEVNGWGFAHTKGVYLGGAGGWTEYNGVCSPRWKNTNDNITATLVFVRPPRAGG